MRIRDDSAPGCFDEVFAEHLMPLLPGANCKGPYFGETVFSPKVYYDTRHRLHIPVPPGLDKYLVFERTLPFSEEERSFMEEIVRNVHSHDAQAGGDAFGELLSELIGMAIVRRAAPDLMDPVLRVVRIYEQWAERQQEQAKAPHTTGVRLMRHARTPGNFFSMDEALLKALGSGPDALVVIDGAGGIKRIEKIASGASKHLIRQEILAPIAYADIAAWANSSRKAVIRLAEDGTILLFGRRRLLFAKRGRYWRSFPHSLINIESIPGSIEGIEPETVKAVYLTALDLADGDTDTYISLLRGRKRPPKQADLHKAGLRLSSRNAAKNAGILSAMLNAKRFSEIPRAVRAEICAMGGVLILDGRGSILGLDLSGKGVARHFGAAGEAGVFPGSGYMDLFNRNGQFNLMLAIG